MSFWNARAPGGPPDRSVVRSDSLDADRGLTPVRERGIRLHGNTARRLVWMGLARWVQWHLLLHLVAPIARTGGPRPGEK